MLGRLRRLGIWLLATALVSEPARARAEEPSFAVLTIAAPGVPKALRARVDRELAAQVNDAGWQLAAPAGRQKSALTTLALRCRPASVGNCVRRAADLLGVSHVVVAEVIGKGARRTVRLSLYEAGGTAVAQARGAVRPAKLRADVAPLVSTLVASAGSKLARVESTSSPPSSPEPPAPPPLPAALAAASPAPGTVRAQSATVATSSPAAASAGGTGATPAETMATGPAREPPTAELVAAPAAPALPLATRAERTSIDGTAGPATAPGVGISVGVGPVLLVPTARLGTTGGLTLDLAYSLPLFASTALEHALAVTVEGGWYPLSGTASGSYSQYELTATGPAWVTTAFVSDWSIRAVPLQLGLRLRLGSRSLASLLGLPSFPLGLELLGSAGGAAVFGRATATLSLPDGDKFAEDNTSSDVAYGWFVGAGAALSLGRGAVVLEARHTSARLDFDLPDWNPELGELAGTMWRLSYRIDL